MKKNNCLSLLTFLLFASAFAFSACSSDDNDESSSKPGSSSDTPKVTSVTKDVSTFGATTNLQLENYDYKVDFVLPISVGEQWTAEIKYDEHDFYAETDDKGQTVDTEEIYQLGYLSATAGGLGGDDSGLKTDVLPPASKEARATQSSSAKIVTLYVFQNVVQNTHNATLTIKYGKTGTENTKVINLEQKAGAENAEANESVAMKQFIGYGYNSRRGYASTLCRRNAIFKVTELMSDGISYNGDTVKIVYTNDSTGLTYTEASGSNTAELEASLKLSVEGNLSIADFSSEIESHTEWTHKSDENSQYAWADIKANKLTAVINTDDDTLAKKDFMTEAAYNAINGLKGKYKGNTAMAFKNLVKQYGTHVVKGGILGGKVNLTMEAYTKNMESTFEAGGMLKAGYDGLFKLEGSADGSYKQTLKNENSKFTFKAKVSGGSKDVEASFGDLLTERETSSSSRSSKLSEWQATLSELENCVFVDFVRASDNLIPLYDLLDPDLEGYDDRYDAMVKYFNEGQLAQDFPIKDQASYVNVLPMKIETENITFSDNLSGSLVKDIYYEGVHIARLCEEYIPQINLEKRVRVLYPADNGNVYWNAGLYAGDAVHKPQSVGWDGGRVVLSEKSGLKYDQYTTFYRTGTKLSTYKPIYLPQEEQDQIEQTASKITNQEYKISAHGGPYNVVKIENNMYTRDFYNGSAFENGTTYANAGGTQATPVANEYEYEKDKKTSLPNEYKNVHYYPLYQFTQQWELNSGFVNTELYEIPRVSSIKGLVSRLNSLAKKPGGSVAAMFMEGGVLGLNLKKTGYLGYNTSSGSNERYYFTAGQNCILGCWDDSDGTTDKGAMRNKSWSNLSKITISPSSGAVNHTDFNDMTHAYKDNWGVCTYHRESADELRSVQAPCYRLILCQPCR